MTLSYSKNPLLTLSCVIWSCFYPADKEKQNSVDCGGFRKKLNMAFDIDLDTLNLQWRYVAVPPLLYGILYSANRPRDFHIPGNPKF